MEILRCIDWDELRFCFLNTRSLAMLQNFEALVQNCDQLVNLEKVEVLSEDIG